MTWNDVFGDEWYSLLKSTIHSSNFNQLGVFLKQRRELFNNEVYPQQQYVFNAFKMTPLNELKVVLIGNEPYRDLNLDRGLAYAVPNGQYKPVELVNILHEVEYDIYDGLYLHYDPTLTNWAEQGVLLLNQSLTNERDKTINHFEQWDFFIVELLTKLSTIDNIIYFLLVDERYESIIRQNPTSYIIKKNNAKPFTLINNQLLKNNKTSILW